MIFISHRGNLLGSDVTQENSPKYISEALDKNFDVEVDVWFVNNKFWLGHDDPKFEIDYQFLTNEKIWCHAKNIEAVLEMKKYAIHYFWHENDIITLTSKNYIWSYPTKKFNINTIAVLPEKFDSEIKGCKGVCSDYIIKYKEIHDKTYNI